MLAAPHECNVFGIYLSPLLVAAFFGVGTTSLLAFALNALRLSRYFANTALVFVALCALFTCLIGTFLIPS